MPVTQSAAKALRRDQHRNQVNQRIRRRLHEALKQARQKPGLKTLKIAASLLDRAAKKKVIHRNKAARLKSKLAKLTPPKKKR